jgi:lipoate synthase
MHALVIIVSEAIMIAVAFLRLMLHSVDRDDLPDGGAAHIAKTITLLKVRLLVAKACLILNR